MAPFKAQRSHQPLWNFVIYLPRELILNDSNFHHRSFQSRSSKKHEWGQQLSANVWPLMHYGILWKTIFVLMTLCTLWSLYGTKIIRYPETVPSWFILNLKPAKLLETYQVIPGNLQKSVSANHSQLQCKTLPAHFSNNIMVYCLLNVI